jgi:hypothetical protein
MCVRSLAIWTNLSEKAVPGDVVITPYSSILTFLPSFSIRAKPVVAVPGSSQSIIIIK